MAAVRVAEFRTPRALCLSLLAYVATGGLKSEFSFFQKSKLNNNAWDIINILWNMIHDQTELGDHKISMNIELKLTVRKYPAIHTDYIISKCTTLQHNHNI